MPRRQCPAQVPSAAAPTPRCCPNVVAFWSPCSRVTPVTEHQPDECIDLERLVQNAQIIANAIVKLANLPLE